MTYEHGGKQPVAVLVAFSSEWRCVHAEARKRVTRSAACDER